MHGRKRLTLQKDAKVLESIKRKDLEKIELYKSVLNNFHELRKTSEISDDFPSRVVQVTHDLLNQNPEFYTAWNERRKALLKLDLNTKLCDEELRFNYQCIKRHPKSYWVFNHRRWIIDNYPKKDKKRVLIKELDAVNSLLDIDARNFHGWDYRRWLVGIMEVSIEKELDFTMLKISQNFSNYSSWHQRSKLMLEKIHKSQSNKLKMLGEEFDMIWSAIYTEPKDQSAWFYHRWLFGNAMGKITAIRINLIPIPDINLASDMFLLGITFSMRSKAMADTLTINGENPSTIWRSNGSSFKGYYSFTWMATLSIHHDTDIFIPRGTFVSSSGLENGDINIKFKKDTCTFSWYQENLSPLQLEFCRNQLSMVQELIEMEPGCRLAQLCAADILYTLNSFSEAIQTIDLLGKKLDKDRKCFYQHLHKRVVSHSCSREYLNTIMSELKGTEFSGYLKILHPYLSNATSISELNISKCNIHSLEQISSLTNLVKLNADQNLIQDFRGVRMLNKLKVLSIKNNSINEISNLDDLVYIGCNLKEIYMDGNPVFSLKGFESNIIERVPSISIIEGNQIDLQNREAKIFDHQMMKMACYLSWKCVPVDTAYCVGAVIVDRDRKEIRATGYSREIPGNTHAEEVCLSKLSLSDDFDGLTLFTTMEPCIRRLSGKKSCIDRIIESGKIETVFYGIREPKKFVENNHGIDKMIKAGINVRFMPFEAAVRALNC